MGTKTARPGRLHRALQLQHHRHTGRKLHHRHTSYRGIAIVLGIAGLSMFGLNMMARATADSLSGDGNLYVYARNPAPIPTTSATITSPTDSTTTTHGNVTVTGTCPATTPRVIVVIADNGIEAGSAACDSGNNFSITIALTAGSHILVARTYTITDDTGPDSAPVTIRYNPPSTIPSAPTTSTQTITQNISKIDPLVLVINHPFIVFGPAKDAVWNGTITGGTLPYSVSVHWGDSSTHTYTITEAGAQSFSHHYTDMRAHDVAFRVSSSDGQYLTRHYAAVTPYTPPLSSLGTTPAPWSGSWPLGLYGGYLFVIATAGFVWYRRHPFAYAKIPVHHRYYAGKSHGQRRR